VYAAWWRDSMVAVKRFNKASDSIHELRMHTAVGTAGNDDCIVPLRGYCRRDNAVYLVMEYCPRCTLQCPSQP
jgi:serine/threonine protein kinase